MKKKKSQLNSIQNSLNKKKKQTLKNKIFAAKIRTRISWKHNKPAKTQESKQPPKSINPDDGSNQKNSSLSNQNLKSPIKWEHENYRSIDLKPAFKHEINLISIEISA